MPVAYEVQSALKTLVDFGKAARVVKFQPSPSGPVLRVWQRSLTNEQFTVLSERTSEQHSSALLAPQVPLAIRIEYFPSLIANVNAQPRNGFDVARPITRHRKALCV